MLIKQQHRSIIFQVKESGGKFFSTAVLRPYTPAPKEPSLPSALISFLANPSLAENVMKEMHRKLEEFYRDHGPITPCNAPSGYQVLNVDPDQEEQMVRLATHAANVYQTRRITDMPIEELEVTL